MEPYELKVCRICFGTEPLLYPMLSDKILHEAYEAVTGLVLDDECNLPKQVCGECSKRLQEYARFRSSCLWAHSILSDITRKHGCITRETLQGIVGRRDQLNLTLYKTEQCDPPVEIDDEEEETNAWHVPDLLEVTASVKMEEVETFETEGSIAVDIASLQHDITMEAMKAERDDDADDHHHHLNTSDHNAEDHHGDDALNGRYYAKVNASCRRLQSLLTVDGANMSYNSNKRSYKIIDKGSAGYRGEVPSNSKPYTCDVCKKTFTTKQHLKIHLNIHFRDEPYACAVCAKAFGKQSALQAHMRLHLYERPYSCNVCKKQFTFKQNLDRHSTIHTGERPYLCDVCNKSFRTRDHMTSHLRIHSGEKPYSCHICHKAFSTKNVLRQHSEVHSGKKSYSCEICNKTFTRKFNLQIHLRMHSGEQPYSCDFCTAKFKLKSSLRNHFRKHL